MKKKESKFLYRHSAALLCLAAILLAAFIAWKVMHTYRETFPGDPLPEHDKWGQFGDYVGGVLNPIFGFASFVALLLTITIQSKELRLSSKELRRSARALKKQNETLALQNFESTFFQLLRRFGELVSEMRLNNYVGREVISELYRDKFRRLRYGKRQEEDLRQRVVLSYRDFNNSARHTLDPYFRTLYHLFKFIDNSSLPVDQKASYANIVRAQLSADEVAILFYNGSNDEGQALRVYIDRYGVLKHLNRDDLCDPEHFRVANFYSATAFMSQQERVAHLAEQG